MKVVESFKQAMRARGLVPPDDLCIGKLSRCTVLDDKKGRRSGSYLLYLDEPSAGGFQNYKDGMGWENWKDEVNNSFTPEEKVKYRQKIKAQREVRQAKEAKEQDKASKRAASFWQEAQICLNNDHLYLKRKGIQAHGARLFQDSLVFCLQDVHGKINSLQFIDVQGNKKFLSGGKKQGNYFLIGKPSDTLCLVEGFATGASVFEATGYAVAVAFDSGNLLPVAKNLREKFPHTKIIVCADDDWKTKGNPGISKAREAAQTIDGFLSTPQFGVHRRDKETDFNDLHQVEGLEAVARCIEAAHHSKASKDELEEVAPPQSALEKDKAYLAEAIAKAHAGDCGAPFEAYALQALKRLRKTSPAEYARTRVKLKEIKDLKLSDLEALLGDSSEKSGNIFEEVPPWPEPVNGALLLDEISKTIQRFIVCEPETIHGATLWAAMTWFIDGIKVCPLAVITAPEKRCGKSQLLTLLSELVRYSIVCSSISSPSMFRIIEDWAPTMLIDEVDTFMKEREELRGIINASHIRKTAFTIRCHGDQNEPRKFSTWAPKALAGIGHLADTLMDRSIVLELRRKLPHEKTERLRHAEDHLFEDLKSKLARFSEDYLTQIKQARPQIPESLNDRAQDNWEPLLAIADLAGGHWPKLAREAALKLSGEEAPVQSINNQLLGDIQEAFEIKGVERMHTRVLLEALYEDDEKPWATYNRGKPLSSRQLAKHLSGYGIKSKTLRIGYDNAKGYDLEMFVESFARYLSPSLPEKDSHPSEVSPTTVEAVTDKQGVTVTDFPSVTSKPPLSEACDLVTQKIAEASEGSLFHEI